MKKLIAAAAAAAGLLLAPANAALIDFAAYADANGEQGLANGAVLNVGGVNVRLFSAETVPPPSLAYHPYLDAGNAGLGVCKTLVGVECAPASDDNVTEGEAIIVRFLDGAMSVTSLLFRDADHGLIGAANDGLVRIATSNGSLTDLFSTFMAMAAGGHAFFANTEFIGFSHVDTQFYVSAIGAEVPLPGALPLLLSGAAGLAFAARRKMSA